MDAEKRFKILVVDDNPKNIQVIGNILKEANYLVGFASDGLQALNQLQRSYHFDLVLLDIDMPVLNGFETCKAIRKDSKLVAIPVIFLTAFADEDKIVAGFDAGAQDYITKPFNSKELLSRVKTHLDLKYKTDQLRDLNQLLEQKVAERTLELSKAISKLEELDNAKTEFLHIISHEIRTPLNGIMGSIELIKHYNPHELGDELLELLDISVKRLEQFSFRTLDISFLQTKGYKALRITGEYIKPMIDKCLVDHKGLIESKNVTIKEIQLPDNSLIKCDFEYIKKVLCIVIGNAIKQSPENETVLIETTENENFVTLKITDKGKGFPEKMLDQTFPPFITGKDHINNNSGLDLHFVKLAMDAHSGKITVGNNRERGTFVLLEFSKQLEPR